MQNFTNFNKDSKELTRKIPHIFYQDLTHKNITKRLRKISKNIWKKLWNFYENFRQGRGANINTQCQNSKKHEGERNPVQQQAQPTHTWILDPQGASGAVGLIQMDQP
jgi:hypothetical protein